MIIPLHLDEYDRATVDDMVGMVVAPQVIDVVLVDSDHPVSRALARLVGWTRDNQQVYLMPDGYLGLVRDPWIPVEGAVGK